MVGFYLDVPNQRDWLEENGLRIRLKVQWQLVIDAVKDGHTIPVIEIEYEHSAFMIAYSGPELVRGMKAPGFTGRLWLVPVEEIVRVSPWSVAQRKEEGLAVPLPVSAADYYWQNAEG
jgi:hypothetical protein